LEGRSLPTFGDWYLLDPLPLRDASLEVMGTGRNPDDIHVGQIIRWRRERNGDAFVSTPGEQEGVRMQVGFLHESAIEYILAGMPFDEAYSLAFKRWLMPLRPETEVARQVKLIKDDIHGTPDALLVGKGVCESFKATWKSLKKACGANAKECPDATLPIATDEDSFREHFWHWLDAEAAYCWMFDPPVDTVRFYVLWMMGDYSYRPGFGPQVRYMDVTWTPEELAAGWREMVRDYAAIKERKVETGSN
jgi:hypothetical protein